MIASWFGCGRRPDRHDGKFDGYDTASVRSAVEKPHLQPAIEGRDQKSTLQKAARLSPRRGLQHIVPEEDGLGPLSRPDPNPTDHQRTPGGPE